MTAPSALQRICVFCGSSSGSNPALVEATDDLARVLAANDIELIYGGGAVGLMGRVADGVMAAGGRVTGVIPTGLFPTEVGHQGITELIEVGSMHERKTLMYELADGFIALPGGLGTLEELAEALTWRQLGIHTKPLGLLDVDGFYQPLIKWFDRAVTDGLLKPKNRALIHVEADPTLLLNRLSNDEVGFEPKWENS